MRDQIKNAFFNNPYEVQYLDWNSCRFYDYVIFNTGQIWGKRYQKFLSPTADAKGYLAINLWIAGKCYRFPVHKLIAHLFIPNPTNLTEINHKDWNPKNNHWKNLEWITHQNNILHSYQQITRKKSSGRKKNE